MSWLISWAIRAIGISVRRQPTGSNRSVISDGKFKKRIFRLADTANEVKQTGQYRRQLRNDEFSGHTLSEVGELLSGQKLRAVFSPFHQTPIVLAATHCWQFKHVPLPPPFLPHTPLTFGLFTPFSPSHLSSSCREISWPFCKSVEKANVRRSGMVEGGFVTKLRATSMYAYVCVYCATCTHPRRRKVFCSQASARAMRQMQSLYMRVFIVCRRLEQFSTFRVVEISRSIVRAENSFDIDPSSLTGRRKPCTVWTRRLGIRGLRAKRPIKLLDSSSCRQIWRKACVDILLIACGPFVAVVGSRSR